MLEATRIFCDLILEMGRKEKKLEVIRQVLCEIPDFEPYTAFKRIDRFHKNYIDQSDLYVFLSDNRLDFSEVFIKDSFLQHYDLDNDGKLLYAEFLRCLLPADHPTLRTIVSQRPIYEVKDVPKLIEDIEYTLAKLISEEINVFIETDAKKKDLIRLLESDYDRLFLDIDENNTGYLDFNNMMDFLQKNGIFPYEEEIIYILRRLDKDDDGRITLLELQNELLPRNAPFPLNSYKVEKYPTTDSFTKLKTNSSSKPYPYEAIRRSASPMKSQIMKSPLKGPAAQIDILQSSNTKPNRAFYESPKKKLDFEEKANRYINFEYNSPVKEHIGTPVKGTGSRKEDVEINYMKNEIEKELNRSKNKFSPQRSEKISDNIVKINENSKISSNIDRNINYYEKNMEKPLNYDKNMANFEQKDLSNKKIYQEYRSEEFLTKKTTLSPQQKYRSEGFAKISEGFLAELAQFLKLIIRCERDIHYLRGDLTLRPDWNLMECFNCYDKVGKGYLNPEEISEFFDSFDILAAGEKNVFLQRFCKTKEIFNLADFVNVFTNNGNQESEGLSGKRNYSKTSVLSRKSPKEMFSAETFGLMKELVRNLVRNEKTIEEFSKELLGKNPVDLKEVFGMIDVNKNGILSEFEVKRFLEKNDIYFVDKDIMNLLDKADKNRRRTLSLNDFFNLFYN